MIIENECKYYFGDLVYVDFGDYKVAGAVKGHRILADKILYKIDNVFTYVPVTMVHKLTEEQELKLNEFWDYVQEWQNINRKGMEKELYCDKMQEIIFN